MLAPRFRHAALHGDCRTTGSAFCSVDRCFVDLDDARNGPAIRLWMLNGDKAEQRMQQTIIEAYEEVSSIRLKLNSLNLYAPCV